ncbi:MAG: tyrosine-type recombinase/integrase [Clostridia bacterium]|nr:tyrosine-type recombinase/integrase [Clostridia bacterium]
MPEMTYSQQQYEQYTLRIRELLKTAPPFLSEFVRGIENTTSVLTRFNYILDLNLFFTYLIEERAIGKATVAELELSDLDALSSTDIEIYLEYLSLYIKNDRSLRNNESAKARKLAAIRSLYKYFFRKQKLEHNPATIIDTPKLHKKPIIRLDIDEVERLLEVAQSGENLTERQRQYHRATRVRDVAMLTLLLGTGIRVSELVGLDVDDIDFNNDDFLVTRKGGNQEILAFGDDVRKALLEYMLLREAALPRPGHEGALFLSMQNKRIGVRAVEKIVGKYASIAAPLKRISPHKLRSTYGTMLYQETGDIYLVAEVLGHKDVNTTKRHYAAMSMDRKRMAAKAVKLHSNESAPGDCEDNDEIVAEPDSSPDSNET